MRILGDLSENDMILAFLAAEVDSPRWGYFVRAGLRGNLSLVSDPDLSNATENELRKQALDSYRGYASNDRLFEGFPAHVAWKDVEVSVPELGGFHYARVEPFPALTGGTLLVRDGAARLQSLQAGGPHLLRFKTSVLAVEAGIHHGEVFQPLIAAADGPAEPHFLLEGHTRATAYLRARAPEYAIKVIVGYVSGLSKWNWY